MLWVKILPRAGGNLAIMGNGTNGGYASDRFKGEFHKNPLFLLPKSRKAGVFACQTTLTLL